MVLLRKLPPTLTTFGDVSDYFLKKIVTGTSRVVFLVTDRYLHVSIKSMEREKRLATGCLRIIANRSDQPIPKQLKKYLAEPRNKMDLLKFMITDWSTNNLHAPLLENMELYVTYDDKAYCITSRRGLLTISSVPELESKQEEADTKMFLCASFAASLGFESTTIITVDSDVAILALHYQSKLNLSLYLQMGTSANIKIYNITANKFSDCVKDALPSLHAISGCD